eukprot:scaffold30401_cov101-Isochrysis_galbana.AAC.1
MPAAAPPASPPGPAAFPWVAPSASDSAPAHRATLVWRGSAPLGPGEWFGLALDAPAGRHDGAILGRRYFSCAPRCGLIVRATCLAPDGGWSGAAVGAVSGVAAGSGVGVPVSSGAGPARTGAARGHAKGHQPSPAEPMLPEGVGTEPQAAAATEAAAATAPLTPAGAPRLDVGAPSSPGGRPSARGAEDAASLIGSHRAALQTIRAIADGQDAIVRAFEQTGRRAWTPLRPARAATETGGAAADPLLRYAEQMEVLCAQHRLVASQLHDSLKELLARRKSANAA